MKKIKCYNEQVKNILGDKICQYIDCPRPKALRCQQNKSPCAYPFYYKSLKFQDKNEGENIQRAKEKLLEKIRDLYNRGTEKGIYGRHNPHIAIIETWIADLIINNVKDVKLYQKPDGSANRSIQIALGDTTLEIGADCILYCEDSRTLILIEFKGYFLDSNSIRSAILNAMFLKEGKIQETKFANYSKKLFYYVGNDWRDGEDIKKNTAKKVVAPLMEFAMMKGYVDGFYGIGVIGRLIAHLNTSKRRYE